MFGQAFDPEWHNFLRWPACEKWNLEKLKLEHLRQQLCGKCLPNHSLAVKNSRTSIFINDKGHETTKPQNPNSIAKKFEAPSVRVDYNA